MAQQRRTQNGGRTRSMSAAEAVARAREQIEELLGRSTDTISSFAADGRNGWVVTVEVVELERIPPSTSVLASYEAKLDGRGDLVEVRRVRRYQRNQVDREREEDE
jgi:hypothetical protein